MAVHRIASSSTNMICVEQEDNSVEFEIEVDKNSLTLFFMGQEYLELEKERLQIKENF